jgi:hypothetical protein
VLVGLFVLAIVIFIAVLSSDEFWDGVFTQAILVGLFGAVPLERTVELFGAALGQWCLIIAILVWFGSLPIHVIDWIRRKRATSRTASEPPQWLYPLQPVMATPAPVAAMTMTTPAYTTPPAAASSPAAPPPSPPQSDWDLI